MFSKAYEQVKKCQHCSLEFPKHKRIKSTPFNIVIMHRERYLYPHPKKGMIELTNTLGRKFYYVKRSCILNRFPYFWRKLLKAEKEVQRKLTESHLSLLDKELDWTPESVADADVANDDTKEG